MTLNRSYWYQDRLLGTWLEATSTAGLLMLELGHFDRPWEITIDPVAHPGWYKTAVGWIANSKTTVVFASHTTLAVLAALIAPLSWIRWPNRFSLRTLLIAMTVVAVAISLIVVASR